MAKFKLDEKNTEYIELPEGIYEVEHETDKGCLIKNNQGEGEWFAKSAIKREGNKIRVAKWMYDKSDLFQA
jgi:hypothetical protein